MMNMGRWDEAREHLLRARKLAPKADYVIYAMAALDCLTGEAESGRRPGQREYCQKRRKSPRTRPSKQGEAHDRTRNRSRARDPAHKVS